MSVAERAKKAAEASAEVDTTEVVKAPIMPRDEPSEASGADTALHRNIFQRTKAALEKQPKVWVRCQRDETVQINGYTYQIKGGERVQVPEQVAELLYEAGRA